MRIPLIGFAARYGFSVQSVRRHARELWGVDAESGMAMGKKRVIYGRKMAWPLYVKIRLTPLIGNKEALKRARQPWIGESDTIKSDPALKISINWYELMREFGPMEKFREYL